MLHLGALPFAMKQFGLNAPVFSTEPVYRLGLLTMYDQSFSRKVSFTHFQCYFIMVAVFVANFSF
jgi:Cft2 family RNA processing exonuclease